jgi:hypothetical protein
MTNRQESIPPEGAEDHARYYLILDEVSRYESSAASDASREEMDEIEQIRQMIEESDQETPVFMTCTSVPSCV